MRQELHWKLVDKFKRRQYVKYELKRRVLKSLIHNLNTPPYLRAYVSYKLATLPRVSAVSKHSNRCLVSGRIRAVMRFCKYSRFVINENMAKGQISNFRRASW